MSLNSFGARGALSVGEKEFTIYRLSVVESLFPQAKKLPFCLKVLLENLLRCENNLAVEKADIEALAKWNPKAEPDAEIGFTPARVLLQDFTGVPCVVDLAAMREGLTAIGGNPAKINPLVPCELVIDHSVQVDESGTPMAFLNNTKLEYERNQERYTFLRWGSTAFDNFQVVPPETGIVHQVNVEFLARVVFVDPQNTAYPDTLVGTDSHTTMVNALGVLGWGVGGIEAEAAMLGQPVSMLIPQVIGFRLKGRLREGTTATDLVLTITQQLRKRGVVGKFVEFFGEGLTELTLADRSTIANMAPEYGATCGIFPVDAETLRYMKQTGRSADKIALVEAYYKEQGMFHAPGFAEASYTDVLELDLATVEPCLAGPSRPQDRVALKDMKKGFYDALPKLKTAAKPKAATLAMADASVAVETLTEHLVDGSVVIAAITSCTNTSNPSVMIAAGLVAKKAVEKGLTTKPWVKTSLAPGSKVVTDYYRASGLMESLEALRFHVVGYGCTTCIGNSGPLADAVSKEITAGSLVVAAVLSGNRNFEGRVHAEVRANYLASPPLVVAYALAGRVDIDWDTEPVGIGSDGNPVFLKDLWPTHEEVAATIDSSIKEESYKRIYASVYAGDENWQALKIPTGKLYQWDAHSTYIANPPYFEGLTLTPPPRTEIHGARVLALLGDSITTDHISPAGGIKKDSPAGQYLLDHGVAQKDFNQYGARRGHHDVMMRGTFANVRLKNALVPGVEGGVTKYLPTGEVMSIFDAAMLYKASHTPLFVIGGKEYGSGSSRDWAAKGTNLLGVKAVLAESYERIHRSNLVGMGVVPLQFKAGDTASSLGLTGEEVFDLKGLVAGLSSDFANGKDLTVIATSPTGAAVSFTVTCRIDTPQEELYYEHGGILPYVLRQLAKA